MSRHICFLWGALFLLVAGGARAGDQDRQLAEVVGRVFGILSQKYTVSGQDGFDRLTLWADARLATVEQQGRRGPEEFQTMVTKMVPTPTGVVLRFMGPFDPSSTALVYRTRIDGRARTFDVLIPIRPGRAIFMMVEHGDQFPPELQREILALESVFQEGDAGKTKVR